MFAPLQWDAERFFDDRSRNFYIESGWDYETGERVRRRPDAPMFERAFVNLNQENQILSHQNYDLYHRMLRELAFEHVLNEWGMLDYSLLIFKMPNDSHAADFIMRACPQSNMVFLVRDDRDVMRSRFSMFASPELATTSRRELRRHAISFYSHFWNFQVDIIRSAFEAHAPERRILIKYEDLRANPVDSIVTLYRHLKSSIADEHLQPWISLDEVLQLAETTRLENVPEIERGPDKPRQSGIIGGFREAFDGEEIALMNAIMGPNLVRYGYEPRIDLPLDQQSKVVLVGEPTGFYFDGWVRDHAVFKCHAADAIKSMSLQIWAPPGDKPLTVTLRRPAEADVTLSAPREVAFVLQYAVHAAPFTEFSVELVANHEEELSDTDQRRASYVIRSITFS